MSAYVDEYQEKEARVKACSAPKNYAYRIACAAYDHLVDGGFPLDCCERQWKEVITAFADADRTIFQLPQKRHPRSACNRSGFVLGW